MAAALSAQERVVELLRTLAEARTDWDGRADGAGVLLMPSMYHAGCRKGCGRPGNPCVSSYRELERRLADLREQDRRLWWHVCHRYRFGVTRIMVCNVRRRNGNATLILPQRCELVAGGPAIGSKRAMARVYQWTDRVDDGLVKEGVRLLTAMMWNGERDRIVLPDEVLRRRLDAKVAA